MNNDNFLIEEQDLEQARSICKYIQNPAMRNRAVANTLAANIAEKYFTEVEADIKTGIHNIGKLIESFEISDIYLNGSYVDVRLYFEDGEMTIPKHNFDNELQPIAYMFIKIEEDLSGGLVTGFVLPTSVDTSTSHNGYYLVTEEDLVSFYDIQPLLVTPDDTDLPDNFESQAFDLLDNKLTNPIEMYKLLLSSEEARTRVAEMANVQHIFNFVSFNDLDETTENSETQNSEMNIEDSTESIELAGENLTLEETDSDTMLLEETSPEEEFIGLEQNSTNSEEEFLLEPADESNDSDMFLEQENTEIVNLDEAPELLIGNNEEAFEPLSMDDTDEIEPIITEDTVENGTDAQSTDEIEIELNKDDDSSHLNNIGFSDAPQKVAVFEIVEDEPETIPNQEVVSEQEETLENTQEEETTIGEELSENSESKEMYSTSVTPSLDMIEEYHSESEESIMSESENADINKDDDLFQSLENEEQIKNTDNNELPTEPNENSEQIDALFNTEDAENVYNKPKQKGSSIVSLLGILILLAGIGGAGYYGYTKYLNPNLQPVDVSDTNNTEISKGLQREETQSTSDNDSEQLAMPNETVENDKNTKISNEGTSVAIPAIEQNLDASILVSNLNVYWEVPQSYISNNTIQRYFRKLGKIIQLNLKTELLLLNKPPISNKIVVELKYNKDIQKFDVSGVKVSSGETAVDKLIVDTINNALKMNIHTSTSSFKTLSGNPMLVIRL